SFTAAIYPLSLHDALPILAFTMVLLAIAAGVSLMLGVIGIYGAMSYIVSQRTAEIGVRLALGAEPGSVAWMVVRQGGIVAFAGRSEEHTSELQSRVDLVCR